MAGETYLLPILDALLKDDNDSVKIHAINSSIPVAKELSEDLVEKHILPLVVACAQNQGSWRLRFAVIDAAALLCSHLSGDVVNS